MTATLPDGLREALGQVIANERREWRRERELIEAQSRETIADLRARIVEIERNIEQKVSDRLAALKDGAPGASVTLDDVSPLVDAAVERALTALPAPKDGLPGKDADAVAIAQAVIAELEERLAAIPPGKDADPEVILTMVSEAVAKIQVPAGRDADPEVIRQMVDEAIAALPAAKDGEPGKEGAPGKLPVVKEWSDRVHYEGEVVTCDGATYQARSDTGRAPPHEDWACIARSGRDGTDGRSFRIRGTYADADDYEVLDIVALNGASFAARKDNPGPCPGEGWQLVASQGKQGKPGERGASVKGDRGPAGPALAATDIDGDGLLTLTSGDGSTVTCDLYPLLAKLGR